MLTFSTKLGFLCPNFLYTYQYFLFIEFIKSLQSPRDRFIASLKKTKIVISTINLSEKNNYNIYIFFLRRIKNCYFGSRMIDVDNGGMLLIPHCLLYTPFLFLYICMVINLGTLIMKNINYLDISFLNFKNEILRI